MLPGGSRVICMDDLGHVSWVGSVNYADPAQPLTAAGYDLSADDWYVDR